MAHGAMALIAWALEWEWKISEIAFRRGLELDPGSVHLMQNLAQLLNTIGRIDEAIALLERARKLDPTSVPDGSVDLGRLYELQGRLDLAVAAWTEALALDPAHVHSLRHLGVHLCSTGEDARGFKLLRRAREIYPETPAIVGELALCHAATGDTAAARAALAELEAWNEREYVDPVILARVHTGLGETEQAFDWLERAVAVRAFGLLDLRDPRFDPIRSDPRFQDLLRRMGLPESV